MSKLICSLILIFFSAFSEISALNQYNMDIQECREFIKQNSLKWQASENHYTNLPESALKNLLGNHEEKPFPFLPKKNFKRNIKLPEYFDWSNMSGKDWMTPVKDQAMCGSCWAFTAIGVLEALINIASNDPDYDIDLSEQYIVSSCCSAGDCSGGTAYTAAFWIETNGVPDEACYPYVARNSNCSERCSDYDTRLFYFRTDSYICFEPDVEAIKQALRSGPVGCSMYVSVMHLRFYSQGIIADTRSNTMQTNHTVIIVGWDDSRNAFKIKNSWGADWGENGYAWIGFGTQEIGTKSWSGTAYSNKDFIVLEPNGGEVLQAGLKKEIKWICPSELDAFLLEYTTDNGKVWKKIADVEKKRNYVWSVPYTPSDSCLVRITSGQFKDESDGLFSIVAGHTDDVSDAILTSDGRYAISCGSDMTVKIWTVEDGKPFKTINDNSVLHCTDTKTSYSYIAAGTGDGMLKAWSFLSGDLVLEIKGHNYWVVDMKCSPDGRYGLTGSYDSTMKYWNLFDMILVSAFPHPSYVSSVLFSPDGKYAASGCWDGKVRYFDLASGENILTMSGHTSLVLCIDIDSKGEYIVSGGNDNTIRYWRLSDGACMKTIYDTHPVSSLAFFNDRKKILAGYENGLIKCWDLETGSSTKTYISHTDKINSLFLNPFDTYFLSAGRDRMLKYWYLEDGSFRNIGSYLEVMYPDGGEKFEAGSIQEIKFSSIFNDSVNISYSIDNGENWIFIDRISGRVNTYKWKIPETPSEECLLKIENNCHDKIPEDESDAVFSIYMGTRISDYITYSKIPIPFRVFPNPFNKKLSLHLPSSASIYSITGQLIMYLDKGKHSLDTSSWREGVYIVKSGMECKRVVKVR
ncbi:MAG: T9SS type A sorting domain-containing protein [Candidatus Coatesbacteria bacterium]|nr:T9SS type A sorting domain-containing protein [Candidatus Coatesbacteria bacterium]